MSELVDLLLSKKLEDIKQRELQEKFDLLFPIFKKRVNDLEDKQNKRKNNIKNNNYV